MATRPRPSYRASTAAAVFAASWFSVALPGCGRSAEPASQPGAEAPASAVESPKSAAASETLEQAEAELEQARLELAQLGGGRAAPPMVAVTEAAPAPAAGAPAPVAQAEKKEKRAAAEPAPAPPPASRAPSRPEKSSDLAEDEGTARDQNPCVNACKAYASLLRAKNAVCRLDVPNGARCARAEGIVRDATPQVQSCQCAP